MAQNGRFVWFELESNDADAALKFYTELIGWGTQEFAIPDGVYRMVTAGGEPVGGFGALREPGLPTRWTSWCHVEDIVAANARVTELGGKVVTPPTQIPPGTFSVISDPQGAELVLLQQNEAPGEKAEAAAPGTFGWAELHTGDAAAASRFYTQLLGYAPSEFPMGGPEPYRILSIGERNEAGISAANDESPPGVPCWLPYVAVEDPDALAERVADLGGQVLKPPADIPDVGRFAIVRDPVGGTLAIMRFGDA